jgi:hypothetical protein
VLTEASKPILAQGTADLARAKGKGLDDPGVIAAYAEVYPVIRWKDHLAEDVRLSVEEFMRQCRARMTDEGWARAHQAGQAKAFPGHT